MSKDKIDVYRKQFDYYKNLLERSIAQLEEHDLTNKHGEGTNSIAVIMKHIAGNMISRWTNIFEEDGEKESRNRDDEFVYGFKDHSELLAYWRKGWDVLFDTLNTLQNDDLEKIIYIRNMGCTVHDAIIRQLCHYSYHIGQVVFISKMILGAEFESLSIPKGLSAEYNRKRFKKEKTIKHFTDDVKDT